MATSRKGILYTTHEGSISVAYPTDDIFRIMQCGGHWDDLPHGTLERQIEAQIGAGIAPDHARRFAHAVAFGGCSEAETWDILKDRDCARFGTMHELISADELPDRWFRDAWSRSPNGGPVSVSLQKAKPIQWAKLVNAVSQENKRRELDLFGNAPIKLPKLTIQSAIRNARDAEELERIWLPELPRF